jgi:hypothetical protein
MHLDLRALGYEGSYDRVAEWEVDQLERVNSASKGTCLHPAHDSGLSARSSESKLDLRLEVLNTERHIRQFAIHKKRGCGSHAKQFAEANLFLDSLKVDVVSELVLEPGQLQSHFLCDPEEILLVQMLPAREQSMVIWPKLMLPPCCLGGLGSQFRVLVDLSQRKMSIHKAEPIPVVREQALYHGARLHALRALEIAELDERDRCGDLAVNVIGCWIRRQHQTLVGPAQSVHVCP